MCNILQKFSVEFLLEAKRTLLELLDEVGKEERGVTDDACSPRLLMLTALEDEPVIHVALRM